MAYTSFVAPARPSGGDADRTLPLVFALRRFWSAALDWRERRATVALLQSLDRRTLKDIGIDPQEIESLVYGDEDRRRRYNAGWRLAGR